MRTRSQRQCSLNYTNADVGDIGWGSIGLILDDYKNKNIPAAFPVGTSDMVKSFHPTKASEIDPGSEEPDEESHLSCHQPLQYRGNGQMR